MFRKMVFSSGLMAILMLLLLCAGTAGAADPVDVNNCTTTISQQNQDYVWNLPIINYSPVSSPQAHYTASLTYLPTTDNNLWFKLSNAAVVSDTTSFSQCNNTAATLSFNPQGNFIITVPEVVLNDLWYSAELQYVPNTQLRQVSIQAKEEGGIQLEVTKAAPAPLTATHACCGVTHYSGYSRVKVCAMFKNLKAGDSNQQVSLELQKSGSSTPIDPETGGYSYAYSNDRSVVKKVCATFIIGQYGYYEGFTMVKDSGGKVVALTNSELSRCSINVNAAPQDCLWN